MENTLTQTSSTALIPVEDIKALVNTAPQALEANQASVEKAVAYGKSLLARMESEGMTPELDALMNTYLGRLKDTLENCNSRRAPLTRFLSEISSAFTGLENKIAAGKPGSIYDAVQKARNEYAALCAEERRKAEAQQKAEQQKATERINLKSEAERIIRIHFDKFLSEQIAAMQRAFDQLTLEDVNSLADRLIAAESFSLKADFIDSFPIQLTARLISEDELPGIISSAKVGKQLLMSQEFSAEYHKRRLELMEQLPGKRVALVQAKEASEAAAKAAEEAAKAKNEADRAAALERQRQAEELQKRQAEEEAIRQKQAADRAQREEQERATKAATEAEMKKSAEMANSFFESAANVTIEDSPAQVRESYEIIVNAQPGWLLLFELWFRNEGAKLDLAKFDAKKLESIKKFCEKHAMKTNERIESPLLTYKEVFKAITTK